MISGYKHPHIVGISYRVESRCKAKGQGQVQQRDGKTGELQAQNNNQEGVQVAVEQATSTTGKELS